jgi:putative modified peptide
MSFQLTDQVVDTLLDKLSCDDQFRTFFASNPRAALAAVGFTAAMDQSVRAGIWDCLPVMKLAPKSAIAKSRASLRLQLTSQFPSLNPIGLEAASHYDGIKRRIVETSG